MNFNKVNLDEIFFSIDSYAIAIDKINIKFNNNVDDVNAEAGVKVKYKYNIKSNNKTISEGEFEEIYLVPVEMIDSRGRKVLFECEPGKNTNCSKRSCVAIGEKCKRTSKLGCAKVFRDDEGCDYVKLYIK